MKYKIEKNTVQETLVIPLYGRKMCSELYPNLYRDETAIRLMKEIDYDFSVLEKKSGSLMQRFGFLEAAMRQNDLAWEVRAYLKTHPCAAVVNLGGQAVQPFLFSLDFELGYGQVFFGAATFAALHIGVPGNTHIVEEIVLQDAVRLLQDWLAVLLKDRLSGIVQQGLGCPLLAPADLHDSLLDGADQCLVLAAFRPQDLLFHHRYIDHMEVVVVDLPA